MNIIKTVAPAVVVAAMALTPLPVAAQGRARANGDRGGKAVERRGGQRQQAGRNVAGPQSRGYAAPQRQYSAPRTAAPGGAGRGNYGVPQRQYPAPRADARGGPAGRAYAAPRSQHYAPRPEVRYGYGAPRPYGYSSPGYYGRTSYGVAPYRPRFEHPYYSFRPRTHIGFGLWLGFGVPYPSAYITAYPPPVYGYYGGRFCVVPGARVYGGVSFDIAPDWAPVYVDGTYVGVASDFGPYAQPLTLVPGPHRVMISIGGYRPIMWNVSVVAGQVIPFRGGLEGY
jgi:hypothetical protein